MRCIRFTNVIVSTAHRRASNLNKIDFHNMAITPFQYHNVHSVSISISMSMIASSNSTTLSFVPYIAYYVASLRDA